MKLAPGMPSVGQPQPVRLRNARCLPPRRLFAACLLAAGLILRLSSGAYAQDVLLFDDFSGGGLDMSLWEVATWNLGRTGFGLSPGMETEGSTTFARFALETYNPASAGTKLLGTEIYSDASFSREEGIVCEARLRVVNAAAPGQVAAFFLYEEYDGAADEIDYEFLTSQENDQALLSSWNDWQTGYEENDGVHHADANPTVAGLDISEWTTLRMYWDQKGVRWEINGVTAHEETAVTPDQNMKLRLSLWAPDANWSTAYDASLAPAASSAQNATYFMDIDYVKVSRADKAAPAIPSVNLLLQ